MTRFAASPVIFKQFVAPDNTSDYGPTHGDLWVDLSQTPPVVKKCTSLYPFIWASIEGGGGGGLPTVVATLNLLNQAANISSTTLYTVVTVGMYRVSGYTVLTQPATGGSPTLPAIQIAQWTDPDTNVVEPISSNIIFCIGGTASSNTLGYNSVIDNTVEQNTIGSPNGMSPPFMAKAGTDIKISSIGYGAGTGTPMQYAAHFRVEYLGT